jgi:SOS-response transcriptional repressor LexA
MMHNARAVGKCLLHHAPIYPDVMGTPGERLKDSRVASGYSSAKAAAEAMGLSVATYVQHENGTRGIPADRAQRYARFFRTTPEWLLYGREVGDRTTTAQLGPPIPIQGAVAAGVWRERFEYPEEEWEMFTGSPNIAAPIRQRFGLRVEGDSMDVLYPPGTVLECVRYWGDEPIPTGKRVIVQRTHDDGSVETTVKEYHEDRDGVVWLVPRSSNPAFQAPFRVDQPGPGVADIRVVALVVASTRYE